MKSEHVKQKQRPTVVWKDKERLTRSMLAVEQNILEANLADKKRMGTGSLSERRYHYNNHHHPNYNSPYCNQAVLDHKIHHPQIQDWIQSNLGEV